MPKTNAERQKQYRAKRLDCGEKKDGEKILNVWISTQAKFALARLSKCYGVTNKEYLENLIIKADEEKSKKLDLDSPEWNEYFA